MAAAQVTAGRFLLAGWFGKRRNSMVIIVVERSHVTQVEALEMSKSLCCYCTSQLNTGDSGHV